MTHGIPVSDATAKCSAAQSILVVIDIQQRLGDAMPGKVLRRVLHNSRLLLQTASLMDLPVLSTEQYPQGLGSTHPEVVDVLPQTARKFEKLAFSCCADAAFNTTLQQSGRRQIIIVGMEAHVCVLQTALDLAAASYQVFVVEDAICSRRLENYQNALDRLRQNAVNVISAESVVFEWMCSAEHEHFKVIQALLR